MVDQDIGEDDITEEQIIWKAPPPTYPAISPSLGVSLGLDAGVNVDAESRDKGEEGIYGQPTPENTFPRYLDFSRARGSGGEGRCIHGDEKQKQKREDGPGPFGIILTEEEFLERFAPGPGVEDTSK